MRRASQLAKQRQGTSHSANSKRPRSASLAPTADTRTISKKQKSAENAGGNVTLRPSLSPGDPSDVGVGHGVEHKVKAHVFEKSKIKTTTSRYTSLSAVFDEYDPDQPFDYEAFCEERESREREEEERKKRENQRKRAETLRYVSHRHYFFPFFFFFFFLFLFTCFFLLLETSACAVLLTKRKPPFSPNSMRYVAAR